MHVTCFQTTTIPSRGGYREVAKTALFYQENMTPKLVMPDHPFDIRVNAVKSLEWLLISTLDDPWYSKYLTRDELENELRLKADGFLGLWVVVVPPSKNANLNGIGNNANLNVIPNEQELSWEIGLQQWNRIH